MTGTDPHDLKRFVAAQEPVFATALAELRAGRKRTHWMWFIFPQLRGLGRSSTATYYGILSLDEARAYLAHPILGPRLIACVEAMNALPGSNAEHVLGSIDAAKFRSCLTLFLVADPGNAALRDALKKYYRGREDERTLALLQG